MAGKIENYLIVLAYNAARHSGRLGRDLNTALSLANGLIMAAIKSESLKPGGRIRKDISRVESGCPMGHRYELNNIGL